MHLFFDRNQLANWLENYADTLELNYWTSSKVVKASQDPNNTWHVMVQKGDGSTRMFVVKHLIFALGFKGGAPFMPQYPGMVHLCFASLGLAK
jgi:cation diffusion facilitator CzcD-associated flavoprotein CzcO